jgi:hypothetical protein
MKRFAAIFSLVFLMIFCLKTSVMAQDEIQKYITMSKDISSRGEFFGIKFDLFGEKLKKVNKVSIDVPQGRKIVVSNQLQFNKFLFASDKMSFNEFSRRFPEGEYQIGLFPRSYGRFKSTMTYNFPNPVITYPPDGTANVPTHLTILWEPLTDISDLEISIKTAMYELSNGLSVGETSFTVYQDLDPNTLHEVSLQATTIDFQGNALITTHTVSFMTGPQ